MKKLTIVAAENEILDMDVLISKWRIFHISFRSIIIYVSCRSLIILNCITTSPHPSFIPISTYFKKQFFCFCGILPQTWFFMSSTIHFQVAWWFMCIARSMSFIHSFFVYFYWCCLQCIQFQEMKMHMDSVIAILQNYKTKSKREQ